MSQTLAAPRPLGRVLRGDEVALYRDAAGALAAAQLAAAQHRAEAAETAEQERTRIMAEADAQARAEAARLLADTALATQRALAGLRLEIAEAIAEGVAKVVGGLDLADAIARSAQRALAGLVELHGITIRISPETLNSVRARLPDNGGLRVVPDETLAADACIIETRAGFIRAGLSEQLAVLRQALREAADD